MKASRGFAVKSTTIRGKGEKLQISKYMYEYKVVSEKLKIQKAKINFKLTLEARTE